METDGAVVEMRLFQSRCSLLFMALKCCISRRGEQVFITSVSKAKLETAFESDIPQQPPELCVRSRLRYTRHKEIGNQLTYIDSFLSLI